MKRLRVFNKGEGMQSLVMALMAIMADPSGEIGGFEGVARQL